jgi:hypothetical protein
VGARVPRIYADTVGSGHAQDCSGTANQGGEKMMSYYDEEFYNEPSEFELMIDDLKASLEKSVKEEFMTEMERLRAENTELQSVKRNFNSIQAEYRDKHLQLELDRENLERTVRRERLSALMKDFEVVMYQAVIKRTQHPKCDKCNDYRKVKYRTPLGRWAEEYCDCADSEIAYTPKTSIRYEFKINSKNTLSVWYKLETSGDDEYAINDPRFAEVAYQEGMQYEDLDRRDTFFKTEQECQGYCDYLNERKDNKNT